MDQMTPFAPLGTAARQFSGIALPRMGSLASLTLVAFLVGLFGYNLQAAAVCNPEQGCMGLYWARSWIMSYADGHTRRAFVGTLLDLASSREVSVVTLNVVGASVIVLIALISMRLMRAIIKENSSPLLAAFLIGPTVMVLVETMGDSLQVALLLFLAVCCLTGRAFDWGLLALLPVSAAIHEGTILSLWPAILALLFRTAPPRLRAVGIVSVVLLGLVLQAVVPLGVPGHSSLRLMTLSGDPISFGNLTAPPLRVTLRNEFHYHFSSLVYTLKFFYQCASFVFWPVLFLLTFAKLSGKTAIVTNFLVLLVLMSPLLVLAHDWGRFAVHLLIAVIAVESRHVELWDVTGARGARIRKWLERVVEAIPSSFALVFPVLFVAHDNYRTWAMRPENLFIVGAVFLLLYRQRSSLSAVERPLAEVAAAEPSAAGVSAAEQLAARPQAF